VFDWISTLFMDQLKAEKMEQKRMFYDEVMTEIAISAGM